MWGLAFAGVGALVKDPEWAIEEEEAAELNRRLENAASAFQKDKTSKLVLWFRAHEPELYFLLGLLTLVVPRLYHTILKGRQAKHAQRVQEEARPVATGPGPQLVRDTPVAPVAPRPNVPVEPVAAVERVAGSDDGLASMGFRARPFTATDFDEISPDVDVDAV